MYIVVSALVVLPLCLQAFGAITWTKPYPDLPPFYAIQHETIPLPEGVFPYAPNWSPDGASIVFNDYNGGQQWVVDVATQVAKCVTCGLFGAIPFYTGFAYIFPGNQKLFVANQLGSDVYILECENTIFNCVKPQLLNVNLTGDANPAQPSLGRRTYHLSPDGQHIGYTNVRPDGLVMQVARLERTMLGYSATDIKVINPTPPTNANDTDFEHWRNAADLKEFKAFIDGGRSAMFVGQVAAQNPDQFKVDLITGQVTRLSTNPDWDEDGAVSPDGAALLTHSWRTMNRIAGFGLFEPALPLTALLNAAASASYFVASRPGYACDLVPWLLPATGDAAGPQVIGQPLAPYTSGSNFVACNTAGQSLWSPDSTRVLLQQRSFDAPANGSNVGVLEFGPAPTSLLIARLVGKAPTLGIPIVETKVGSWAPSPQSYKGNTNYPGSHILPGVHGSVNFTIKGDVLQGTFNAIYSNFSDDGLTFVHGTNSVSGSPLQAVTWTSDLISTGSDGKATGHQLGNVTYAIIKPAPPSGQPSWTIEGPLSSSYGGMTLSGYQTTGACPEDMPKPQQLEMQLSGNNTDIDVLVWSNIYGDTRPVLGATVCNGNTCANTDWRGMITLHGSQGSHLVASAGTFLAVSKPAPL